MAFEDGNTSALVPKGQQQTIQGWNQQMDGHVAALAAQAKAQVEARYVMAVRMPRDMDDMRVRILSDCRRAGFAGIARYAKPVGKTKDKRTGDWSQNYAEGWSIRFAEAAIRAFRNVYSEETVIVDSETVRMIRVAVTDLEGNITLNREVTIQKQVERRYVREGQEVVSSRTGSDGQTLYLVLATEDEIATKQAATCAKAWRTLALKFIPGDILDDALAMTEKTLAGTAQDPEAQRKKIVDAFAELGVRPGDLKIYLGHEVSQCSPAELETLRKLYAGIKSGEFTWKEALRDQTAQQEFEEEEKQAKPSGERKNAVAEVKEKIRQVQSRRARKPAAQAVAPDSSPAVANPAYNPAGSPPTSAAAAIVEGLKTAQLQRAQDLLRAFISTHSEEDALEFFGRLDEAVERDDLEEISKVIDDLEKHFQGEQT